jgi:hypothetical protein
MRFVLVVASVLVFAAPASAASVDQRSTLSLAFVAPIRAVFPAFARLHWTRPALDRSVAASLRSGLATLALVPPDLCGDIAAAAASGFTTIPAETSAFVRAADGSMLAPGPSAADLVGRMQRYIAAGDAAAVRRLHRLERRLDALFSKPVAAAYARLDRALTGG